MAVSIEAQMRVAQAHRGLRETSQAEIAKLERRAKRLFAGVKFLTVGDPSVQAVLRARAARGAR